MRSQGLYIAYKIAVAEQDGRRIRLLVRALVVAQWFRCLAHRSVRPVAPRRRRRAVRSIHAVKHGAVHPSSPPAA